MSLRKNTLNKIKNNIKRARRLGTIDPKTKLEDLGEAIRKDVRMKERERIPDITREKMKKAQEKRDRKKVRTVIIIDDPIPTEGRDKNTQLNNKACCEFDYDKDGNCHIHSAPGVLRIDSNGIKNDSSK